MSCGDRIKLVFWDDHAGARFVPVPVRRLTRPRSRGVVRRRIDNRRDKLRLIILGNDGLRVSGLPALAEQLLWRQSVPPGHPGNRIAAWLDLRDHPRLVLVAASSPTTGSSENLKPTKPAW